METTDRARAAQPAEQIRRWRDDDSAGYDRVIELVCEAEAVLTALYTSPKAEPPTARAINEDTAQQAIRDLYYYAEGSRDENLLRLANRIRFAVPADPGRCIWRERDGMWWPACGKSDVGMEISLRHAAGDAVAESWGVWRESERSMATITRGER